MTHRTDAEDEALARRVVDTVLRMSREGLSSVEFWTDGGMVKLYRDATTIVCWGAPIGVFALKFSYLHGRWTLEQSNSSARFSPVTH